ncbi:MAG TPA: 1-deoxy-D-xylulose-5-phosphate reductoisomerase [Tepidisphaeraceae bacterium]|nr:1-deoxy-D-xylulose-5-phosphate reductoisomerase [Tepidisphaeraceae bacterium]
MRKNIAILGATGSIGCNALDVIESLGDPYRAVALSGHRQTDKLLEQVRRHRPAAVAIADETLEDANIDQIRKLGVRLYRGPAALIQLVERDDVDVVLAAVVGAAGLPPVLAAVRAGKKLALANKESLVVAGSLLVPEARKHGIEILPIDSEHSAIFQAIHCGRPKEIRRLILTASGGPFRKATRQQIENATLADALNHPTWRMGNKITIDSATMFNKALEIIEACWLFDVPPEKVDVVIHPESVVHSMVEFVDNSVIAQLGPPDMRTPIQYALTYPERTQGISGRLDLSKAFSLNFEPPDFEKFPALQLAYQVARKGGTAGAVLNAAKEAAVDAFIEGNVSFGEISRLVRLTMDAHQLQAAPTLDDLLAADRWARNHVRASVTAQRIERAGQRLQPSETPAV